MASRILTDDLWTQVRELLPERMPRPSGGRPPIGDREVLTGVLFVLKTGIAWEDLPEEMGSGCGMTCMRRLRQWQQCGVWQRIQDILQTHLRDPSRYDWSRARDGVPASVEPDAAQNCGGELQLAAEDAHESPGE